jgi:ATP-binding cassette subfamily F protein 3
VILISHDRYLLDACADQLWVVGDGRVSPFDGTMDDYTRLVLSARGATPAQAKADQAKGEVPPPAPRAAKTAPLKKRIAAAEEKMAKLQDLLARVDQALAAPDAFTAKPDQVAQLARQRGDLERALAAAEDEWLQLSAGAEPAPH